MLKSAKNYNYFEKISFVIKIYKKTFEKKKQFKFWRKR